MCAQKNRNQTLDILKLVASFLVVCIHYMFSGSIGESIKAISRFAVPFFFAISGYFVYGNDRIKIMKKIKHILTIYIGSFLFYFCFSAIKYIIEEKTLMEYFLSYVNKTTVLDFFVLNETVSSGHLWFLPALVYCYLIYNVIMNKLPDKVVLSISLILMFFYLTAEEFLPIISVQLPTYVYGNAIVRAFPCFMLGFAVKKYKQFLSDYIPTWGSFVILGVGILETIISSILFGNSTTYLGSIFIIFALLLLAMKFEKKTYNQVLVKLSGYSLYIYVFHIAIGGVLQIFLNYFGVGNEMWWINIKPIVVFVFSIILSFVIDYVLNFIRDKRTQLVLNE